jgi:hypothetical protein
MADGYKARLQKQYEDTIIKAMTEKFGYTNPMQVPKLDKIVLNMGVGEATQDKKKVEQAAGRNDADRRPEGCHHQGEEVDRAVQAA